MKALVLENYMQLNYRDVEDPLPGPDEVLVRIMAAGICGSDVHGMDGSTGRRIPPIIMGHEAAGIIEKTGDAVTAWQPGDRVTFDSTIYKKDDWFTAQGMYNLSDDRMVMGVSTPEFRKHGAFAEFVTVPQYILYRIPGNVSFSEAALTEPAAVALHAINLSSLRPSDRVLVIGAGMVGSLLIQLLKIKGCHSIVVTDTDAERLKMAQAAGATHIFLPDDPVLKTKLTELSEGRGADIVYEVVGIEASVRRAIASVRKGGTIILVGNLSPVINFPLQQVVTKQLTVQGSCAINGEYPEILQLISEGRLNVRSILSAEAPLAEGPDWFSRLYKKESGLMKVILKP